MDLMKAIEDSVIESIFERGWIEQSPDQFIQQCRTHLDEVLKGYQPNCSEHTLNQMILNSLMQHLGDEFDVNIYRLRFFPAERVQEYDV
jgi:hypothetical protein